MFKKMKYFLSLFICFLLVSACSESEPPLATSVDPVIEEIREIRRRISKSCGHDPRRLVERYRRQQGDYADRLWPGRKFSQPAPDESET